MTYVSVLLSALFLTVFFVFLVQKLALRVGVVSSPGGRSIHEEPTPLWGGLAVYMTFSVLTLLVLFFGEEHVSSALWRSGWKLLGLFCGATCILVVGLIDDMKPLRARTKLLFQTLSAVICVLFGFTIQAIDLPWLSSISLGPFGAIFFIFWVIGIVNAVNLIDGMDGLASTVCFFASLGNGIIALQMGNPFIAVFSFLISGCMVGFLFHNFPPAKIFLGDTGSMLLGFLLAVIVIESNTQKRSTALILLAPVTLLAFSLLDVFLSVVRRFLRGKPIMSSDLGHIHHRLMRRFRNPRRVLLIVGIFSFLMMCISVAIHRFYTQLDIIFALLFLVVIILLFFVFLIGYFRVDRLMHVIHDRGDLKFFFSLIAYVKKNLQQSQSIEEVLYELDWVCHALKPLELTMFTQNKEVLFHYRKSLNSTFSKAYQDSQEAHVEKLFYGEDMILHWRIPNSQPHDPESCDLRLAWHELMLLFREQSILYSKLTNEEQDDEHAGTLPVEKRPPSSWPSA